MSESFGHREDELFVANSTGWLETGPPDGARSGSFVFAAAYTSGLTPCSICAASSSEPANESFTFASG